MKAGKSCTLTPLFTFSEVETWLLNKFTSRSMASISHLKCLTGNSPPGIYKDGLNIPGRQTAPVRNMTDIKARTRFFSAVEKQMDRVGGVISS